MNSRIKREFSRNLINKAKSRLCDKAESSIVHKSKSKKQVHKKCLVINKDVHKVKNKINKVKRNQYSLEAVEQAIKFVKEGASLRKAGNSVGVPATTLYRRINKSQSFGQRTGPATVLTKIEEDEIVNWLIYRAETGAPVTKIELLDSVQNYLNNLKEPRKKIFRDNRPGKKWYEQFKKRHPNISLRTPQNLPLCRANVTEETLKDWFAEIEEYLIKKNLINIHASRVFNCDETNFPFNPKPPKVLVKKGAKAVYKVVDASERENITTLFMYNAEGLRAPPMTLFVYKDTLPKKIVDNAPPNWSLGISDTGWMTTETFYEYIVNVFYPFLVQRQIEFPVLLYLDGHASHVTVPLVSFCREKQIEIITLYPHSTHITQPLDIAFFHPLKDVYSKRGVPKWKDANKNARIQKEDFVNVLNLTLDLFENEKSVITSGFKAAGLYPFDPNAVDYNILKKSKKSRTKSNEREAKQICDAASSQSSFNTKKFLLQLEETLPVDLLNQFNTCLSNQTWTGLPKYEGFFEYWLQLKIKDNVQISPTIPSSNTENLSNNNQNSILTNLEMVRPPRDKQDEPDLDLVISNEVIDIISSESQNEIKHDEQPMDLVGSKHTVSPRKYDSNHEKNMAILSDILQGNVHISPMKESFINNEALPTDILTGDLLVGAECSEMDIQNLLGRNLGSSELIPVIDLSVRPTNDEIMNVTMSLKNNPIMDITSYSNNVAVDESVAQSPLIHTTTAKANEVDDSLKNAESENAQNFHSAFTLPTKYLPKKKRIKLEQSGKQKAPSVGTSDEWWRLQQEKEKKKQEKEMKLAKKKELQQRKKLLAERSKQIQAEINSLSKIIKEEK